MGSKKQCSRCGGWGAWKYVECRPCWLADKKAGIESYRKLRRTHEKPPPTSGSDRQRKYRKNNPDKERANRRRAWEIRRLFIYERKAGPCRDCGLSYHPEAMDFDHVRGVKLDSISKLLNRAARLEIIEEEIKKCDLVCANCHRVRTMKRRLTRGQ